MFFSKSAFVLSFLALGNIVAAAQPPACLLSVVGAEKNPADLKAVCITNGDDVQKNIADTCGDSEQAALKWFADTCDAAGYNVVIKSPTTSGSSATGTSTKGSTSTNTGFITATATGSSSSGSSKSGTSSSSAASASQTVSAGSSDRQVSAAAFAAVVFFGFAASL
ncbi:putative GPI anchored cell wall protein [Aspergillus thermomutatus]|uniref:Extracellular membrane protein CFEM domain-containing protein n=1 Tax=Aspergillus thermomutatus TaxID=41047 RepID=A0A397H144_ASPTH|nr:uncharacterized protein CDV56_106116 [Aspergillus thermomutatus]RHZ54100.1 hypothetical protein CDV56_106116 [Aspergillus thermomutatus]